MQRTSLKQFNTIHIFRDLPLQDIMTLTRQVTECDYKKDSMIVTPHEEKGGRLYLIKTGEVTLYRTSGDGRRIVLDILTAGDVFGFVGDSDRLPYFAQANDTSHLCILPIDAFWELLTKRPDIAKKVIQDLSRQVETLQQQITDMTFSNAATRVHRALQRYAEKYGKRVDDGTEVTKRITHETIAQLAGLTRESTTKALQELTRGGCVRLTMKRHYVLVHTDVT